MLNKLQQSVHNTVLKGDEPFTVLTGAGGTGKTEVASVIAKTFPGSVAITASTNKAASVLRQSTGMDARTIQSQMGFVMKKVGYDYRLVQERNPDVADLIIVDEVSMLPQIVHATLLQCAKKVLFLGDQVQLPAIGAGVDTASIPGTHIELTEQMRQSGLNPLTTQYLQELRCSIETGTSHPKIPATEDLIVVSDFDEFADLYNNETGTKKIISYRNQCVGSYNRRLSGGAELFSRGDRVVIDAPVGDDRNGDVLTVHSAIEHDDRYIVELSNGFDVIHWKSNSAKYAILNPLKGARHWNEFWEIMKSSVDLKHLYACTSHKSQGSSYGSVFIDGTDLTSAARPTMYGHPITQDMLMRLSYVSISRMRKRAIIFNGTNRNYAKLKAVK